jgi:integrase
MILEKYRGKAKGDLAIPVIDLVRYNIFLKEVAQSCGITKKITSHLARHTFATLTLTKGVSIESVSKMLGHTNINTTQIYAKITNKKIDNEMNLLAGNIKRWDRKSQLPTDQEEISIETIS